MALDLAPYTTAKLPLAAIRGNDPWWAAPRLIHHHNVVFFGAHGPGFCGRSQAAVNSPSTSVTVSFPAGTTAGDFVLVCITSSSGMCAAPAGWAQVGSTATNSVSQAMGLFWKIYTVSDGASVTFGTTDINFPEAVMRVYCGVAAIDANNSATSASTVTSLQVPALTATKFSNEIYVGFWSNDDTATNGPSDLIDQTSSNYDGGVTATWSTFDGDKVLPTAGTVPPAETANLATGQPAANWMGFAVTLILMDATPALRVPPPPRTGMIPWVAPIAQARTSAADIPPSAAVPASSFPIAAIQQAPWAPVPALHPTTTLFSPANPVPYDTQMAPLQAVQAGMAQWIAPVVRAQAAVTPFHGATENDARPSQLPLQAVQQSWWAPVVAARHTIAPFQAANPVPYDQPMAPFQAVQAGMAPWVAPIAQARTTTIDWHAANPPEYTTYQLPSAAVQQAWQAPVAQLRSNTLPFRGATENDARPAQLPIAAIQQFPWAPIAALHISPTDVNPPPVVGPTDTPNAALPIQAVQQGWWAPVPSLRPSIGVLFSPANPPEFTIYKLPSSAVQGSWWSPLWGIHATSAEFKGPPPVIGVDAIVVWRHRAGMQ